MSLTVGALYRLGKGPLRKEDIAHGAVVRSVVERHPPIDPRTGVAAGSWQPSIALTSTKEQ
jgi:hypothetical protein